MFKKTIIAILFFVAALSLQSEEMRGIWIVRWDVDDPIKVFTMMEDIKRYNINTLFVQVYARCEAMYKSDIVPRSSELLNAPFNYDALDLIIQLGHQNGYKVHAWINLYYAWSHAPFPPASNHIANKHPEWFIGDEKGISLRTYSIEEIKAMRLEGYFLEPGNNHVREHLVNIVKEIIENYDVDGIHMDYCRYPRKDYGYDVPARVAFLREFYVDPMKIHERSEVEREFGSEGYLDLQLHWDNWRRERVTITVREIFETVKLKNPEMQVSVAVIG
ncbi:MAG: hypothetical protein E3J78_04055, partial [Candidatus Cloacimonadota bacterium]